MEIITYSRVQLIEQGILTSQDIERIYRCRRT